MSSNYLTIVVENSEVDYATAEGLPISITYSLDAVEDVAKLSGFFTKRGVLIPANDRTREVFGFFEEASVNESQDLGFKEFQIESGGIPVLWGRCRLRRVEMQDGIYWLVGENYYVDFLGNNVTWFEDLKKLKLKELGFGSHVFDVATISTRLNVTYAGGNDYGYCPIKLKPWEEPGKILWKEFVPFLFIRSILREIFKNVGLEIVSTFLDHEPIQRLIMPVFFQQRYSQEFFLENTDVRATYSSSPTVTANSDNALVFDDESTGANFDNGNNYDNTTGAYSVPLAGRYQFDISFDATFTGDVVGSYFVIFVNGVEVNASVFNNPAGDLRESNTRSVVLELNVANVGFDVTVALRLGAHSGGGSIVLSNVVYKVSCLKVFTDIGATVNFDYLLRDSWTADKFVLGFKDCFNLMIDSRTDEGKVYIEPMDPYTITWRNGNGIVQTIEGEGYFKSNNKNNKTIDFDLSKKARLKSNENSFTEYILEYQEDSESIRTLDQYENIGVYGAKYQMDENRHKKGDKVFENRFFAKMLHILDSEPMAPNSSVVPQIPFLWPYDYIEADGSWLLDPDDPEGGEDGYEYDLNFGRMLYFAGQRIGIDGTIVNEDDANISLPAAFMVNYNDPDNSDFSLSYGNEVLLNGSIAYGLMHRFYLHYLKRLDEGKRLEGYVYWDDIEVMDLDFRRKMLINDVNFLLRKIDGFNPVGGNSAKTIMDLDVRPFPEDAAKVSGAAVEGYVKEE